MLDVTRKTVTRLLLPIIDTLKKAEPDLARRDRIYGTMVQTLEDLEYGETTALQGHDSLLDELLEFAEEDEE